MQVDLLFCHEDAFILTPLIVQQKEGMQTLVQCIKSTTKMYIDCVFV